MKLPEIENILAAHLNSKDRVESIEVNAGKVKDKIWEVVENRLGDKTRQRTVWWPVAASVLLLLTGSLLVYSFQTKNSEIAHLKAEIGCLNTSNELLLVQLEDINGLLKIEKYKPPLIDTVYQTKVVYLPADKVINMVDAEEEDIMVQTLNEIKNKASQNNEIINYASLNDDCASFKIEYGAKTKEGFVPWKFKVIYQ